MLIHLKEGYIEKIVLYTMSYYPEPNSHSRCKIKVKLDLSKYGTKTDLKVAMGINAS